MSRKQKIKELTVKNFKNYNHPFQFISPMLLIHVDRDLSSFVKTTISLSSANSYPVQWYNLKVYQNHVFRVVRGLSKNLFEDKIY